MSALSLQYSPTPLADLGHTFEELLDPYSDEGFVYSVSSHQNVFVFASQEFSPQEQDIVEHISELVPGRYFVFHEAGEESKLEASIAARCYRISDTEHICSEIVRLSYPSENVDALKSVVLAHRYSGGLNTIIVLDPDVRQRALDSFIKLGDELIFDSRYLAKRIGVLQSILQVEKRRVDLAWVSSSSWRREIAQLYARAGASCQLHLLKEIRVYYAESSASQDAPDAVTWLLAGWLAERLSLDVMRVSSKCYDCEGPGGSAIELSFAGESDTAYQSGPVAVELVFDDRSDVSRLCCERKNGEIASCAFDRDGNLDCRITARFDDPEFAECLERHISVGESVRHYPDSLHRWLEFDELARAFRGDGGSR